MLDLWRYLRQFSGVPGAPTPAGVPVDRRAELEAELAPVFAALAQTQNETDALVANAKAQAEQRRAVAAEQARGIAAAARAGAPAEQSRAAATRIESTKIQERKILEDAQTEAARIDRVTRERIPVAIEELIRRVLKSSST